MKSHGEPMSAVDTAWLRMERPANLMMICIVLVMENPVHASELKQLFTQRLLPLPRFRQTVHKTEHGCFWRDDANFNIDNHVHLVGLPGVGSQQDLQDLASDISSTPLDFSKPLWQVHLVDRYQSGSAMIIRVHHCIADGIALTRVLLSLADQKDGCSAPQQVNPISKPASWSGVAAKALHNAMHIGQEIIEEGKSLARHPEQLLAIARQGVAMGSEVARVAALPADPATCFKGDLSGRKRLAWAQPLNFPQVKQTAQALKATINDVLLCAATGALRRYLVERCIELDVETIHAAVPFNLRPPEEPADALGNQFGLVIAPLPIGVHDVAERFEAVRRDMLALKHSQQAKAFYGLLGLLGKGPDFLEQTALEMLSRKASVVITNVPGPKQALYLAGSKLLTPMIWAPQSGEVGISLSIISYDGAIQFGVAVDQGLIPDPDKLAGYFVDAFAELRALTKTRSAS
ncbi:WS/DGAT/MGAT family O-acyltransferase [Hahella sp. NBU794]|uniref:WS/DGAT/MGAT family O-acyltransferase n=1 Tax=Hahella sp. NBU794 TaxID=3422590 RepID=UPI003D6FBF29